MKAWQRGKAMVMVYYNNYMYYNIIVYYYMNRSLQGPRLFIDPTWK
jgi:hypothetical protein